MSFKHVSKRVILTDTSAVPMDATNPVQMTLSAVNAQTDPAHFNHVARRVILTDASAIPYDDSNPLPVTPL
jgi:hypothetical protein